jgi:hypothetical protein
MDMRRGRDFQIATDVVVAIQSLGLQHRGDRDIGTNHVTDLSAIEYYFSTKLNSIFGLDNTIETK